MKAPPQAFPFVSVEFALDGIPFKLSHGPGSGVWGFVTLPRNSNTDFKVQVQLLLEKAYTPSINPKMFDFYRRSCVLD